MKKYIFVLILCCPYLHAQIINMYFPHFAGQNYDFIIFQGSKAEKVIQGTIPLDGKFTLQIPKSYVPYIGMSRWLIMGSKAGGGLDMVIPGKDFSVSCKESQPDNSNIIYTGNPQTKELDELYTKQQQTVSKYSAMTQAKQAFSKNDRNYPVFTQEYENQKTDFKNLYKALQQNPDYAKKLLPIINITMGIGTEMIDKEQQRAQNIAHYIANEMDWDVLYTSGHWSTVISAWISIHTQVLKDSFAFVNDFAKLSNKITDKRLYADFAQQTAYYLTQNGQDSLIGAIAPYVTSSGKIDQYIGSLAAYNKGMPGTKAPDLVIKHAGNAEGQKDTAITLKSNEPVQGLSKTLVIFYESGCGPCENLLQQLLGNEQYLTSKGIQIISVSADKDENTFKAKAKNFSWHKAYCDYEGMHGINFKNYGVAGTPTLFLIDQSGVIKERMATLEELLVKIK